MLSTQAPGTGYAELGAGITAERGAFAWGEVGERITQNQALFIRGEADSSDAGIYAGWKWEW